MARDDLARQYHRIELVAFLGIENRLGYYSGDIEEELACRIQD